MVYLALISTTLLALAGAALTLHLAGWWLPKPEQKNARRGLQAVGVLLLLISLFFHPIVNRWLFQPTADRRLAQIQATLGQPVADLDALAIPHGLPTAPNQNLTFGQIRTYELAPPWLFFPLHRSVDVLVLMGTVQQVGDQHAPFTTPGSVDSEANETSGNAAGANGGQLQSAPATMEDLKALVPQNPTQP